MHYGFFPVHFHAIIDHLGGQWIPAQVKFLICPGADQGDRAQGDKKHKNRNGYFEGCPGVHSY